MTRDLAAVAFALEMLHENNLSLNGFSVDRALGSYGPELQLIPGQLPQSSNSNNCNEDYESLVELIASCFCVEKAELWLGLVQDLRKTGHLTYSECKDLKKQWPNSISTWGHALTTLCELLVENKSSNFVTYFKNELRLEN